MGRRMMTRDITRTTVTIVKNEMVEGQVKTVVLPNEVFLGNVKLERAQRLVDKKYVGERVTVLEVDVETTTYELEVEKFLEMATIKEEVEEEQN